jgi:uncharacterized protein (DUF1697 family)
MNRSTYILLFRGINVGGNKIVKMETLRRVLTEAGFGNVTTYIQSGNVVLTSEDAEDAIVAKVRSVFDATFGFSSRPTVRSLAAWQRVIDDDPFKDVREAGNQVHAVFVDAAPAPEAMKALEALATTEQLALRDGVLYLYTPDGFGRSEVAKALDKALKVPLTARNWNSVLKLRDMAAVAAG